jgi:hypothetical protein
MAKSTHIGTCQICGRSQKLPSGRIAQHGYTVQWGSYNGICNGTGQLPFEQSKDFLQKAVHSTEAEIPQAEVAATKAADALRAALTSIGNHDTKQHLLAAQRSLSQQCHGMKAFVKIGTQRCEAWKPAPLKPAPTEADRVAKRKVFTGIRQAASDRDAAKRVLSKLIDGFDTEYLRVSAQLVTDANTEVSHENRRAVGFNDKYYYAQPNTATIIKFLDRMEADPSQSKFVKAMADTFSAIRVAHTKFTAAKDRYDKIKQSADVKP